MTKPWSRPLSSFVIGYSSFREGLHRFRLWTFSPAFLAGATGVIVPELEHRFAEMLHDVGAVETNVLHPRFAVRAIKNHVLFLPWRPPPFHHHAESIRWPHWRMRHVG